MSKPSFVCLKLLKKEFCLYKASLFSIESVHHAIQYTKRKVHDFFFEKKLHKDDIADFGHSAYVSRALQERLSRKAYLESIQRCSVTQLSG